MKNPFRRKSQPTPQIDPKVSYSSIPFTADHPFMEEMAILTCGKILESDNPEFAKLKAWLTKHQDTQPYLEVRKHQQQMDQNYHGFRQYAIKSQILTGFALISQYEKYMQVPHALALSPHPNPEVAPLWEANQLWTASRTFELKIHIFEDELRRVVCAKMAQVKATIARLLSLLASIDAVPLDHIPIVRFEGLTTDENEIAGNDERCKQFDRQIALTQEMNARIYPEIAKIAKKYTKGSDLESIEVQAAAFHRLIAGYRQQYDVENRCMKIGTQPVAFLDFLRHPHSSAFKYFKDFAEKKSCEAFRELTANLIQAFGIESSEECSILNALVSNSVSFMLIPSVKADGKGTDDDEQLFYGLQLFVLDDPMTLLQVICDKVDIDDVQGGVQAAFEALETITSAHYTILTYIYEFTSTEYLSGKMNSVRFTIGEMLDITPT